VRKSSQKQTFTASQQAARAQTECRNGPCAEFEFS
jgi:hypothetical protein